MTNFSFSQSNADGTKIDLAVKICKGQPRVMIYMNFVVVQTLLLHTKFQGNWPIGSGGEDLLGFWAFFSMSTILVIWGSFI